MSSDSFNLIPMLVHSLEIYQLPQILVNTISFSNSIANKRSFSSLAFSWNDNKFTPKFWETENSFSNLNGTRRRDIKIGKWNVFSICAFSFKFNYDYQMGGFTVAQNYEATKSCWTFYFRKIFSEIRWKCSKVRKEQILFITCRKLHNFFIKLKDFFLEMLSKFENCRQVSIKYSGSKIVLKILCETGISKGSNSPLSYWFWLLFSAIFYFLLKIFMTNL